MRVFTLNETGRLFLLLRNSTGADALHRTGRDLTAVALDAGMKTYSSWTELIARKVNDSEFYPKHEFEAHRFLEDIDPSLQPSRMHKGGSLRTEFQKLWPKYTAAHYNCQIGPVGDR